jgi:hypothetical protein
MRVGSCNAGGRGKWDGNIVELAHLKRKLGNNFILEDVILI